MIAYLGEPAVQARFFTHYVLLRFLPLAGVLLFLTLFGLVGQILAIPVVVVIIYYFWQFLSGK